MYIPKNRKADDNAVLKFRSDRKLLPYTDTEIAIRIGMGKGNYSKIATGKQSITYGFLTKFYIAFGSELNVGELDEVKLENLQDEVQQLHKELFGFIQRLQQLAYYLTKLTSYVKKRIG